MARGDRGASKSIWETQIHLPPRFTRLAKVPFRALIAVWILFLAVGLVLAVYQRVALGPGARLKLTDGVSIRVPAKFSAFEFHGSASHNVTKSWVIGPQAEESGGLVAVEALTPGSPDTPSLLAAYAMRMNEEVRGPVHFRYSGFEVTATVLPNVPRSNREGPYRLSALVDVSGQLVAISGDNVTLGVASDAGPQSMAETAIDLIGLTAK